MKRSLLFLLSLQTFISVCGTGYDSYILPEFIQKQKLSSYLIGFIRTLFGLSNLVVAIFANKSIIERIGRLNLSILGSLLLGISLIVFNLSFQITNSSLFLTNAIIFTLLYGIGASFLSIGNLALVAALFPSNLTFAYAVTGSATNLGLMLKGIQYNGLLSNGYMILLNIFIGVANIGIIALKCFFLPGEGQSKTLDISPLRNRQLNQISRKSIFEVKIAGLVAFITIISSIISTSLSSIIQLQIQQELKQNVEVKQLIFVCFAVSQVFSSLITLTVPSSAKLEWLIFSCALCVSFSLLIIGLFTFHLSDALFLIAYLLLQITQAALSILAPPCSLSALVDHDPKNSQKFININSSLYNLISALGLTIGGFLGVTFFETMGFNVTLIILGGASMLSSMIFLLGMVISKSRKSHLLIQRDD